MPLRQLPQAWQMNSGVGAVQISHTTGHVFIVQGSWGEIPQKDEVTPQDQALRERFGSAIRATMMAKGVKPQEIADTCGISLSHQYRIQTGEATPDALYLYKLAERLSVTVDTLLGVEE